MTTRKYKPKAIKRKRGPVVWRKDPDARFYAGTAVIFAKDPVSKLPGFDNQFRADATAVRKAYTGEAKNEARRSATDAKWQPLRAAIEPHVDLSTVRNFNAERRRSIKRAMVQVRIKPFANPSDTTVSSFITWLKRRQS